MQKVIFECKVITPIICFGINQNEPELRVPSLRGVMRYWWRAIHADLSLEQLREQEVDLFGGSFKNKQLKSSFSLEIVTEDNANLRRIKILPHKGNSHQKNGIAASTKFDIILRVYKNEVETIKKLTNLLILTSILGGIGGRTRRGLGSFKIETVDNIPQTEIVNEEEVIQLITKINPRFSYENSINSKYPTIENIQIAKRSYQDLTSCLYDINDFSHRFNTDYTGYVRGAKYSSPIYVTVNKINKDYCPVVTTLKRTIPDGTTKDENNKNGFINAVLGGK